MPERYYPIYVDSVTKKVSVEKIYDIKIFPIDSNNQKRIWRRSKVVIKEMFNNGELYYHKTKYGHQIYFKFRGGIDGEPPQSIWMDSKFSASEHGTKLLDSILAIREAFQYPKSTYAIEQCINITTKNKNATILDFFAGSGTTAQAVLQLNKKDEGKRKFIICTNNEDNNDDGEGIAESICYPRVKNIITGYKSLENETIPGIGGNLNYYKTDFVPFANTDSDKRALTNRSTEMLCMAEETYDEILFKPGEFSLFENKNKITAIIYDEDSIDSCKAEIKKHQKSITIYVFSYDKEYNPEDFDDLKGRIKIKPIPEAILNIYRRIGRR